jgi:hypothetical protein
MPGKGHHTQKWHDCWEKVQAQGHDASSAAAICTASLEGAGEDIMAADSYSDYAATESAQAGAGAIGKPFKKAKALDGGLANYHAGVPYETADVPNRAALEAAGRMVGGELALGGGGSGPHKGFKQMAASKRDRFHEHVKSLGLMDDATVDHGPHSSTYKTPKVDVAKAILTAAGTKGHRGWTTPQGDHHVVHVRF